ncbi:hypothetical protein QAD02_019661 [Eretmocerus hayati]|uniref:Uncharacterized protein n=1 Tax=Eretmocerus hayati TaxID=131215 RepID=A0ACC2PMQ7_9HYME|nr:hypothetical protein QAD02_019661 [Eretmocerus hayati]
MLQRVVYFSMIAALAMILNLTIDRSSVKGELINPSDPAGKALDNRNDKVCSKRLSDAIMVLCKDPNLQHLRYRRKRSVLNRVKREASSTDDDEHNNIVNQCCLNVCPVRKLLEYCPEGI